MTAMHPAVAQIRAWRLATEIEIAERQLHETQLAIAIANECANGLRAIGDPTWKSVTRSAVKLSLEAATLETGPLLRVRDELRRVVGAHDILIPGAA